MWGVTSDSGESSKRCFQCLGKLPNALSSLCPGKTYVPTSSVRRRSRYSTTGNPMGRMDSPSLLSSNRKQLASVSASVHFKPIISLRRQPVKRKLANDVHGRSVFLLLGGVAEHLA